MLTVVKHPALSHYRRRFFRGVAEGLDGPMVLYYSSKRVEEPQGYELRYRPCRRMPLLRLEWQSGVKLPDEFGRGDVLVLSGNPRIVSNYPLWARARWRGAGIVCWSHGWSAGSRGWGARLRQRIMRRADVVLLYTEEEKQQYVADGFSADRIFATNNTIDTYAVDQAIDKWPEERLERFQVENDLEDRPALIFCGRLTEKTQLDLCIRALPAVAEQVPRAELVVIGDGDRREAFESVARELGVEHMVRWCGAIYEEEQLAPWFLSASAFVYPGAIGLSLQHAFTYGLPVITHDDATGHMPEFAALKPGENGLVFRPGDLAGLTRAVLDILTRPDLRDRMAAEARRTLEQEYSLDNMIAQFVAAVERAGRLSSERNRGAAS